jgi:hypothetical protein
MAADDALADQMMFLQQGPGPPIVGAAVFQFPAEFLQARFIFPEVVERGFHFIAKSTASMLDARLGQVGDPNGFVEGNTAALGFLLPGENFQ